MTLSPFLIQLLIKQIGSVYAYDIAEKKGTGHKILKLRNRDTIVCNNIFRLKYLYKHSQEQMVSMKSTDPCRCLWSQDYSMLQCRISILAFYCYL